MSETGPSAASQPNSTADAKKKAGGISGCTLKIIAIVTMLIDHVAAVLVYRALVYSGGTGSFVTEANYDTWNTIYMVMRGIGRMAFPIFCYLIVEGFHYTRSATKYAIRLLIFALISEVPFDLALFHSLVDLGNNNVYFTLLLGLLAIMGMDTLEKKLQLVLEKNDRQQKRRASRGKSNSKSLYGKKWASEIAKADSSMQKRYKFVQITGNLAIALTAMLMAEYVLCTDYGAAGVLTIMIMYLMQDKPEAGFAMAVIFLGLFSSALEFAALLMLIPLHFYNGTRGHQLKYFFYAFYPVHLLLIVLAVYLMGLPVIY